VRHWLASGRLQQQWQSARGPLSLLAGLIALLLVLRVYGALLALLDSLPLVPGLLELVGVIAITRFSLTRLLRSNERQAVINDLQQRWQAFRGKA
jgi:CAAD domains of cyanobacterial aminoacyl-tRNA synthetase